MADVICLGELLIDFVPTQTGINLRAVPGFKKLPGGAPANVVVGLKRFGVDSAFMGKVGDDAFGHFLAATLQLADIDIDNLLFSDEARTALAFIALDADGERDFMFYCHPSADMLFRPEEVDADAIRAAQLVHFGSLSLRPAPVRAATLHALDLAQQSGCLVSYDPNLRLSLWADADAAREGLLSGLARAHIVKMSEDEVIFLSDGENLDAAIADLWHPDLQLLVVTRGSRGCRYFTPDSSGNVEAFQVTAVDATGAGDGFVAGLLQGIVKDPSTLGDKQKLKDLCRFANAAGALTTTSYGAIPALPDLQQVNRFLDENG
ncbi:MAG TPA: PfkB family carbohydrate kinase [Gammaproteobacteria bacterium]|nr:PfkB family carbohydrate kinase [Gammaproteobacteria bacterium]